jgi:hypothetical protein
MKTGYELQGASALIAKLTKHPELIARAKDSVLAQEARALCVSYGFWTEPRGLQEKASVSLSKLVEGDVRAVFASRQSPPQVYALLQVHAPQLAKASWHAYKAKKPRRMGQILTAANLPQGIDPGALKAARTGPGARVRRKTQRPVSLATEAQVRARVKTQQRLVGFAKAGWYAAAKALGGRVRRNYVTNEGKRATAEIFPDFVRKLARRHPGIGGARVSPGRVEIFTNVRHADVALTSSNYMTATDNARASLAKSLKKAVHEVNRRTFGGKAAA